MLVLPRFILVSKEHEEIVIFGSWGVDIGTCLVFQVVFMGLRALLSACTIFGILSELFVVEYVFLLLLTLAVAIKVLVVLSSIFLFFWIQLLFFFAALTQIGGLLDVRARSKGMGLVVTLTDLLLGALMILSFHRSRLRAALVGSRSP
jgi:hypothetical protein